MDGKPTSYMIGIDAGTTSVKGILMDDAGQIVASAGEEYELETGGEICELDSEIYWKVTCRIVKKIINESGIDAEGIKGVAFSSQGETIIPLDNKGIPLRKAIVWLDNRSGKEAGEIREKFGSQHIMDITGQPEVLPLWPATRILWLKKHEPDLFSKVGKYLLVEDYLIFRMTGKYFTEHSLVSSTLYFDISQKKWWNEMLDFLEISAEQLPELSESGKPVGNLTEEASSATGLSTKTICVTGAYDHPAGAIGSGNINSGDVTLTIGASMAMCVAIDNPVKDLSIQLPCQCHSIGGLYFLLPYGQTAGMVLKWFKDEFCKQEIEEAEQKKADAYDLMIEQGKNVPPGSEGLLMLPHLMGTGSPEFNPKATGIFAGIKMGMGKGHFVRAIIEAVSLMIHHNLQTMRGKGIEVNVIHLLGGASKSNFWCQVLADVTGLPVITLENTETSVTGACLLAGTGSGIFKDLEIACAASVRKSSTFHPDIENHKLYKLIYKKYVHLYKSLEDFWKL